MHTFLLFFLVFISAAMWGHFILKKDKVEREPLATIIIIGLIGGFLSAGGTLFFDFLLGRFDIFLPLTVDPTGEHHVIRSLFIGLHEEFFKCAVAVALMWRLSDLNEPVDAVIYAMTVALGFAAMENILYLYYNGLAVIVPRTLISVPGHISFGALWGIGIAYARYGKDRPSLLRAVFPWFLAAAIFHALFDFVLFAFPGFGALAFDIALVLVLWRYTSKRITYLVGHSPFLTKGCCPECGHFHLKIPDKEFPCQKCGATIYVDRDI